MDKRVFGVAFAAAAVLGCVMLATGALGRDAPTAAQPVTADAPPAVLHLPLPGSPGYPPKLSGPATAKQEILPNLIGLFPGIPNVPGDYGYPAVSSIVLGGATHYILDFNSGFTNAGPGPVLVWGHRKSTAVRDMSADQYIRLKDGSYSLRRNVGALRYIQPFGQGTPHLHWHYLGAELYAIYPAGHFNRTRHSAKQGFCMSEPASVFTDYCGYKNTNELGQIEGMYAHESDYYGALVEGQYIDITGLAAGKYDLINWVNSDCLLKETNYGDNAGTIEFTLSYPTGPTGLPVVTPGTEMNDAPHLPCPAPAMTTSEARQYVQQAVVKHDSGNVSGLRVRCSRNSSTGYSCSASWDRGTVAFAGRIAVDHVGSTVLARYRTALSGISTRATFTGRSSGREVRWSETLPLLRSVGPAHS